MADADDNTEEWRDIPGFEGVYEASSKGRIRRAAMVLKPDVNPASGYLQIKLGRCGYNGTVHRLICMTFHGSQPKGCVVAHGDGNRKNNQASNLRWATYKENFADSITHGTVRLKQYQAMRMRDVSG